MKAYTVLKISHFNARRSNLAYDIRQARRKWFSALKSAREEGHERKIKFFAECIADDVKELKERHKLYYNYLIVKPTLNNIIAIREDARRRRDEQQSLIDSKSYVTGSGYSLCGMADLDGEMLNRLNHEVLLLTSLIVRIKKGEEIAPE